MKLTFPFDDVTCWVKMKSWCTNLALRILRKCEQSFLQLYCKTLQHIYVFFLILFSVSWYTIHVHSKNFIIKIKQITTFIKLPVIVPTMHLELVSNKQLLQSVIPWYFNAFKHFNNILFHCFNHFIIHHRSYCQWSLAYCYGHLPGTLELSNICLG